MQIFNDRVRDDFSPALHSEGHFHFYDRAAGSYWSDVRELIEDWFSRLCQDAQRDVRSRLRSRDDRQFNGAFLELFLHESLVKGGFKVRCHPEIAGSRRRVDFFADNGDRAFYLEARAISPSDQERAAAQREATVHDALNGLRSPNFYLDFQVHSSGPDGLPTKALKRDLELWLSSLDPDGVAIALQTDGLRGLPSRKWKQAGWDLSLTAIAKSPESRAVEGHRTVAISGRGEAYAVKDAELLRSALADKGTAYGSFDHPYVVGISLDSLADRDWDVANALYGDSAITISQSSTGQISTTPTRTDNGYWVGKGSLRHPGVSAVLITPTLFPHGVARTIPTLWHHPSPDAEAPVLDMWRSATAVDSELVFREPASSPSEHFKLSNPWPTGKPFDNA